MRTTKRYDEEAYGRMELFAYYILISTLLGVATLMYLFYSWLIS